MSSRPEHDVFIPTLDYITCPECGKTMEAQWHGRRLLTNNKQDCVEESTVFHCWDCDYDHEIIRLFDMQGNKFHEEGRRFYFG